MTAYATADELAAYTGGTAPADAARLLTRASELIDEVTRGRAPSAWADPLPDPLTADQAALRDAACAQVEFWMSFGEDHDVEGVRGSVTTGAVTIAQLPDTLAVRAARTLRNAGLLTAMVGSTAGVTAITVDSLD